VGDIERDPEAAGRSRGSPRALRRDRRGCDRTPDNETFAKAQIGGRVLVGAAKGGCGLLGGEAARLQIVAHETAQTAHGEGRAIEFAKRGEAWRPSNTEDDITR